MKCYRDKSKIIYNILDYVRKEKAAGITGIMYDSRLSHYQLKDYIVNLLANELIVKIEESYMITEKGLDYVKTYEECELMLCFEPEMPKIKRDYRVVHNQEDLMKAVRAIMAQGITDSYEVARLMKLPRGTVWHVMMKLKKVPLIKIKSGLEQNT